MQMKSPVSHLTTSDKLRAIDHALHLADLPQLRHFCVTRFGLVSDQMRKKAWPLLLGLTASSDFPSSTPLSALRTKYAHQIEVDIVRSLLNFDLVKSMSPEARKVKAAQLTRVITRIVSEDTDLHYFQGFHDICTVFLLVAGEELGYRLIRRFVYMHCREAMRPTFDQITTLMGLIISILREADPPLSDKLLSLQQEVTLTQMPMFALSWVITYFSHVISHFDKVTRIFDFCLGTHPLAVVYLSAGVIITDRTDVMTMMDLPDLHRHFSQAVETADWDALCVKAEELMQQVPPKLLIKTISGKLPIDSPIYEKSAWLASLLARSAVLATSIGSLLAFTYIRHYAV